jgi:hypothetical protein
LRHYWRVDGTTLRLADDGKYNQRMLVDASEPLQNPVQLEARLTALMSMLEAQNGAVERLRVERDTFRAERDTANAEVEKLQLIIKQLTRSRWGAVGEARSSWQR